MKSIYKSILCAAMMLIVAGMLHAAQPTPPLGPPPGEGPMGNSAEFQKAHRYAFQLMRLVGNIGRLESTDKSTLTSVQAKKVLAVLQPLGKLKSLDEPAAKKGIKALQDILTDKQRSVISALPPEHQFRQGGPPPPGPRPFGPPPKPNPKELKNFNPLNPPAGMRMGHKGPDMLKKLFDDLKKKSGNK